MGLFDINDEKLQALYHRALVEANYGLVNPRKYPYLDRAIMQYARENGCSYDQALILAKTGNKMFQEAIPTSYYVMSDIHGCYDDMIKMLEQITFTDEDTLILAGDYIDRGSQSFEMLKWIESNAKNVIFLRGNHDEEFAYSIDLMYGILSQNECSESTLDDTKLIYELLRQLSLKQG